MKNQIQTSPKETADLQAKKAIQRIQKWVEESNPRLAAVAKYRLVIECLIEMAEERKYLAARN